MDLREAFATATREYYAAETALLSVASGCQRIDEERIYDLAAIDAAFDRYDTAERHVLRLLLEHHANRGNHPPTASNSEQLSVDQLARRVTQKLSHSSES